MARVTRRKSSEAGKASVSVNVEAQELLLMGSALSEQFMGLLSQVATTPMGMGAAASALAMAWATLKDVAVCEGVDVVSLFESEVAYYEDALVDSF
jgi:hypothetical protein